MSLRMNNYEQRLAGKIQFNGYTKRQAEQIIMDIREELYGNPYAQIRPTYVVNNNGDIRKQYPNMIDLIIAYEDDNYYGLEDFITNKDSRYYEEDYYEEETEENKKEISFEFVRNGTTAEKRPEIDTIWVDVGNKMEKGIIDHHGEEKDDSVCATEMIYKHPELVLENISDSKNLRIIGHIFPDFDCVASAYLVKQIAEKGEITPEMKKIVEYAKLTDTGRINPGRNEIKNPYSILNAFAYMPENTNVSFDKLNENIMKKGFELLDYCMERIKENPELTFESEDLIEEQNPFIEELKLLDEASKQYEEVLKTSEKTEIIIPESDEKSKRVSSVFVKDIPENELARDMMKNWLRNDGYVFTSIPIYTSHKFKNAKGNNVENIKTSRVILSVAPGYDVNLKGLGKMIEDKETQKCKEYGITRYSKDREGNITYTNRPGYESPDPWYDGRGHNYEIIDGPMSGSVLTVDEINNIVKEYSKHIENVTNLIQVKKQSDGLSDEIAQLGKDKYQSK